MKSVFYHVKINVSDVVFYKNLLIYLGFKLTNEYPTGFGASDGQVSIWVFQSSVNKRQRVSAQSTGLNHLAFRVESIGDVEKFYEYLLTNNVRVISKPAEHPAYNGGKGYYAVFFEDPDGSKLEVAYVT